MGSKKSFTSKEAGTYLVLLVAVVLPVALGLLALTSIGLAIANRIKLQNVANLTALSALNGYVRQQDATNPDTHPNAKDTSALSEANRTLSAAQYRLLNSSSEQMQLNSDLSIGSNGQLQMVRMIHADTPGITSNIQSGCNSTYPCLVTNPSSGNGGIANAALLTLQNSSPVAIPFSQFIGGPAGLTSKVQALVTSKPRCIEFLLDMSFSIEGSTFGSTPAVSTAALAAYNSNPNCGTDGSFSCPMEFENSAGLFVFHSGGIEVLQPDNSYAKATAADCENYQNYNVEQLEADNVPYELEFWCSMIAPGITPNRIDNTNRPAGTPLFNSAGSPVFYGSDYVKVTDLSGETYYVNSIVQNSGNQTFGAPEPWYSFMASINAVLRDLKSQATSADKVGMFGFSKTILGHMALSYNIDLLIQLTNPSNRGTLDINGQSASPTVHPNFFDKGWYPLLATPTDLKQALDTVVADLTDTTQCSSEAQKIAVIASDGLMNVYRKNGVPVYNGSFDSFSSARKEVVTSDLMSKIIADKIQFIVLQFGAGGPQIKDILNPDTSAIGPDFGKYLFPDQMLKLGLQHYEWGAGHGEPVATNPAFVFNTSNGLTPDVNAISGSANYTAEKAAWAAMLADPVNSPFRGANGVLFDLARFGLYCPLSESFPSACSDAATCSNYYACDGSTDTTTSACLGRRRLKDSARDPHANSTETSPLFYETLESQAAQCVRTFTQNIPFQLEVVPSNQVTLP